MKKLFLNITTAALMLFINVEAFGNVDDVNKSIDTILTEFNSNYPYFKDTTVELLSTSDISSGRISLELSLETEDLGWPLMSNSEFLITGFLDTFPVKLPTGETKLNVVTQLSLNLGLVDLLKQVRQQFVIDTEDGDLVLCELTGDEDLNSLICELFAEINSLKSFQDLEGFLSKVKTKATGILGPQSNGDWMQSLVSLLVDTVVTNKADTLTLTSSTNFNLLSMDLSKVTISLQNGSIALEASGSVVLTKSQFLAFTESFSTIADSNSKLYEDVSGLMETVGQFFEVLFVPSF